MSRRPLSITLIGWLYVLVGIGQLVCHLWPPIEGLDTGGLDDLAWVVATQVLSIAAGALLLCGSRWGRWLLAVWIVEHVVLSALHSVEQLAVHAVLFSVIAYLVFRPSTAAYFRRPPIPP